jgi:hypothetical protein
MQIIQGCSSSERKHLVRKVKESANTGNLYNTLDKTAGALQVSKALEYGTSIKVCNSQCVGVHSGA